MAVPGKYAFCPVHFITLGWAGDGDGDCVDVGVGETGVSAGVGVDVAVGDGGVIGASQPNTPISKLEIINKLTTNQIVFLFTLSS